MQVETTGLSYRKGAGKEGKCGTKDKSCPFGLRSWVVGVAIYCIQSGAPSRCPMQGIRDGYSVLSIHPFSTTDGVLAVYQTSILGTGDSGITKESPDS